MSIVKRKYKKKFRCLKCNKFTDGENIKNKFFEENYYVDKCSRCNIYYYPCEYCKTDNDFSLCQFLGFDWLEHFARRDVLKRNPDMTLQDKAELLLQDHIEEMPDSHFIINRDKFKFCHHQGGFGEECFDFKHSYYGEGDEYCIGYYIGDKNLFYWDPNYYQIPDDGWPSYWICLRCKEFTGIL